MPIAGLALLYGASPLVVSAWGSDVFRASPRQRIAWRLVAHHADMLMGSSRALVQGLEDLGAPADRTALLNWGVDLGAFAAPTGGRHAARRALGLPPGPMILSPRSDGDVYNADIIVRAFDRVADERNDITLVLLRSPADGLDLGPLRHAGRVRVVGRVPHELMADYYGAADVCVSIASSDSSPRSVWEAMACGAPCVLSDIPWVRELIERRETRARRPDRRGRRSGGVAGIARQPRARRPNPRRCATAGRGASRPRPRDGAALRDLRAGRTRRRAPLSSTPGPGSRDGRGRHCRGDRQARLARGADQRQAGDS